MINPFERFYDTEVAVCEQGERSYDKKDENILLGMLVCDIQPYRDDTESKLYGLESERSYKLYCDRNELLKKGRYILFGDGEYLITSTEVWSFGMTAIVRSVENEG